MIGVAKNNKLYCIVGNIGVGKSELVKRFRTLNSGTIDNTNQTQASSIVIIPEPVKLWQQIGLLPALYRDFKSGDAARTGTPYMFQQLAFSSRLMEYLDVDWQSNRVALADGHVFIDRHVFAQQLYDSGMMSAEQMTWYLESFKHWEKLVPLAMPVSFIYLRAEPSVCFERIQVRGRDEEKGVSLEYLTALHNRFETIDYPSPVIIVDASQSADQVFDNIAAIIGKCKVYGQHEFCSGGGRCYYCESLDIPFEHHHCMSCAEVYQLPRPSIAIDDTNIGDGIISQAMRRRWEHTQCDEKKKDPSIVEDAVIK